VIADFVVMNLKRRECPNDPASMLDCAKIADLVLLCVDAKFGFEMETFEFLNILQTHGFPKVMGVFTHLDQFNSAKNLRKTKKLLKHRFWTEIYEGAKMFYFSGVVNGKYLKNEVKQLTVFVARVKVSTINALEISHSTPPRPLLHIDEFVLVTSV
jgi:ribosome biogenesis protein BMS1